MALSGHSQRIYDVQIGGCALQLKTNHHPDKVEQLIQVVESKLGESLKSHSNISVQKALILSCLNLAEDYMALKNSAREQLDVMESKVKAISDLLKSSSSRDLNL